MKAKAYIVAILTGSLILNYSLAPASAGERGSGLRLQQLAARKYPAKSQVLTHQAKMNCAQCKDINVSVPDLESRGTGAKALLQNGPPTRLVSRHLCSACQVDWKSVGQGKAKETIAVHQCAGCSTV